MLGIPNKFPTGDNLNIEIQGLTPKSIFLMMLLKKNCARRPSYPDNGAPIKYVSKMGTCRIAVHKASKRHVFCGGVI